jgi:hypothetical protein
VTDGNHAPIAIMPLFVAFNRAISGQLAHNGGAIPTRNSSWMVGPQGFEP